MVEGIWADPLEQACVLPCASPVWSCLDIAPLPMCRGPNLASPDGRRIAAETAATGLEALPHMAEIYPLGGERVCVPAAVFSCGEEWYRMLACCSVSLRGRVTPHACQDFILACDLARFTACLQRWGTPLPVLCSWFKCMATSVPPCSQVLGTGWA